MCRYLPLKERQESAGRSDAVGPQPHELAGSAEKFVEQPRCLVAYHAAGRGAGHDLEQNRKRPGLSVAHITRDPRKPRLKHQDADPGPVERLAAPCNPCSLSHRTTHWQTAWGERSRAGAPVRLPSSEPKRDVAAVSFAKTALHAEDVRRLRVCARQVKRAKPPLVRAPGNVTSRLPKRRSRMPRAHRHATARGRAGEFRRRFRFFLAPGTNRGCPTPIRWFPGALRSRHRPRG